MYQKCSLSRYDKLADAYLFTIESTPFFKLYVPDIEFGFHKFTNSNVPSLLNVYFVSDIS